MKRYIVVNSLRTAIVISDFLVDAINLVSKDTDVYDEIFAFDTQFHVAYAYKVVKNGFTGIEFEVPVKEFRSFSYFGEPHDIYVKLISSFIK